MGNFYSLYTNPRNDNIPFEIQVEIIKRFPVKSIIRYRSVSKTWKSLIDSPQFIAAHSVLHDHSDLLFVHYYNVVEKKNKYVCFVDDDTFPKQKFDPTVPSSIKHLKESVVVGGSSSRLFCFYGYHDDRKPMAVVWNPTIRKSIDVPLLNVLNGHEIVLGFGVCPVTSDLKIVMAGEHPPRNPNGIKVFSLSSGTWTSPNVNLPYRLLYFLYSSQVVIDRFIYWLVSIDGDEFHNNNMVISFDLTNNEFGQVPLPNHLALKRFRSLSIVNKNESLALIEADLSISSPTKQFFDVWMMEGGVPKSFIKVFTIEMPYSHLCIGKVLGFRRKNDEPTLEVAKDPTTLILSVFAVLSQDINFHNIMGLFGSFSVFSYKETLLLLNQQEL